MKDIHISGSRIKSELIVLAISFLTANVLNIYSIAKFKTRWSELIGQLHVVVIVTLVIIVL